MPRFGVFVNETGYYKNFLTALGTHFEKPGFSLTQFLWIHVSQKFDILVEYGKGIEGFGARIL